VLRTERLRACYGLFQALFDVNIRVGPSEVVALIGSNGAGKSTLFRSIVGSVRVSPRSVWLDDVAVGGETERRQLNRGVVLVPEGRQLFPSLSVLENLQLAARNGRRGQWTIERLFDELSVLRPLSKRPATSLSGGQQQLVAIGRALVTNPSYLLCDEVSLGLSPLAVTDVYSLLKKASADGTAIVLVEQNVNRALSESDRFYCLQKGRVMLEGESAAADRAKVAQAYFGI
jgi:branched-chain amino acid transport system ATP-binding protein